MKKESLFIAGSTVLNTTQMCKIKGGEDPTEGVVGNPIPDFSTPGSARATQGTTAGANIINSSGQPGSNPTI